MKKTHAVRVQDNIIEKTMSDSVAIDLETYQAALVVQGDELKKTQQELALANRKLDSLNEHFNLLYHHAPHGYVTLDKDGVVLEANELFTHKLNLSARNVINRKFTTWILPQYQGQFRLKYRGFFHDPSDKVLELELMSRNAEPVFVSLRARKVQPSFMQATYGIEEAGLLVCINDITVLKSRENDISRLAYFDDITGLANRRLCMDRLNSAVKYCRRHPGMFAVFFLDLDRFKAVNDSLGHLVGDLLLQEVAQRIKKLIRDVDTLARMGGDEFVILFPDVGKSVNDAVLNAEKVAEKIAADVGAPYYLQGRTVKISTSIGITLFPVATLDSEELIRQADQAMYEAKKAGKNCVRFFQAEMQLAINDRILKENGIKAALGGNEFYLVYQPKVDNDGKLVSVEALARWNRPGHGVVMPAEFIDIAEQSDLIYELWLRSLDIVCEQSNQWGHQVSIAINVSPRTFRKECFIADVKSMLRRYTIPTGTIIFELTENVVLDNIDEVIVKMNMLIELGVRFSLDDFGTGYSSLKYLQRLPITELKIDRAFVSQIGQSVVNDVIVDTVISLGKKLQLDIVAEGIENQQQLEYLINQGCGRFQGYYFSKPVNATEIQACYLAKN